VGTKLEAAHKKKDVSLLCAATVADVIDNRILVHIDGEDDKFDYWTDTTSHFIHPAGWGEQNGHKVHGPTGNYVNIFILFI